MYIKLQKKVGGKWVSTNKTGEKIYAVADDVAKVFDLLKRKRISPQETVIGYIERYGQTNVYLSLSIQTD